MASVKVLFNDQEVMTLNLQKDVYVIGRQEGCEIHVDNLGVSRMHARILNTGQGYIVEDMDSSNGTFVNGEKIKRHTLEEGDQVTVGKHTIIYSSENVIGSTEAEPVEAGTGSSADLGGGVLNTMAMDSDMIRKKMAQMREKNTAAIHKSDGQTRQVVPEKVSTADKRTQVIPQNNDDFGAGGDLYAIKKKMKIMKIAIGLLVAVVAAVIAVLLLR